MPDFDIGGDDSVAWSVTHDAPVAEERDKPKRTLHETHRNENAMNIRKNDRWIEGRDPTNTTGKYFKIDIKLPREEAARKAFLNQLQASLNQGPAAMSAAGAKITVDLPIEDRNHDQIHIKW